MKGFKLLLLTVLCWVKVRGESSWNEVLQVDKLFRPEIDHIKAPLSNPKAAMAELNAVLEDNLRDIHETAMKQYGTHSIKTIKDLLISHVQHKLEALYGKPSSGTWEQILRGEQTPLSSDPYALEKKLQDVNAAMFALEQITANPEEQNKILAANRAQQKKNGYEDRKHLASFRKSILGVARHNLAVLSGTKGVTKMLNFGDIVRMRYAE